MAAAILYRDSVYVMYSVTEPNKMAVRFCQLI